MARKQVPAFNPKQLPLSNTTLARQVAKQNLTSLNHSLWVTENSYPLVRSSFAAITMPTGVDAHGCYGSAGEWSVAVDEQRLWVRQHVLVSGASLLEVYLTSAMAAALWACPEYADRSLSGISEVELIKFPDRAPGLDKLIRRHIKSVLQDRWHIRFRQMAVVFGKLPSSLIALSPRLQALQDKRNRIAHAFGQDGGTVRKTPWQPVTSIQLNLSDAEEALVCVSAAIREADVNVFGPLIGGYELLHEYHVWLQAFTDPFSRPAPYERQRQFRKHIAGNFGHGPGKNYLDSLIRYYEGCK